MKHALLYLGLLASLTAVAQTPFTQYFGERGLRSFLRDYTINADNTYSFHGYGNFEGVPDADQITFQVNEQTGNLDSTVQVVPRNQLLFSADEDGTGGAIVALQITAQDAIDQAVQIQFLDNDGTVTNSLNIENEFSTTIVTTEVAEDGSYYLVYTVLVAEYSANRTMHMVKVNPNQSIDYDVDIDLNNGFIYDIVPLPGGSAAVLGFDGEANDIVVAFGANGEENWRQFFDFSNDNVLILGSGVLYEGNLLVCDLLFDQMLVLDPATGETIANLEILDAPDVFFSNEILADDGRLWIVGRSTLYEMVLDLELELFSSEMNYPIENRSAARARLRAPGVVEIMNRSGHLQQFNANTGLVTTLEDINYPTNNFGIQAAGASLVAENDTYRVSVSNSIETAFIYQFAEDGTPISSTPLSLMNDDIGIMIINALPNGETGILFDANNPVDGTETILFQTFNEAGELLEEQTVLPPSNQNSGEYFLKPLSQNLVAGHVELGNANPNVDGDYIFFIDPSGENEIVTYLFEDWVTSIRQIAPLATDAIGLVSSSNLTEGVSVTLRNISLSGGLEWESDFLFEGLDSRSYNGSENLSWIAPGLEGVGSIFGINILSGDGPPVYHISILGEFGNPAAEFTAANTYISAALYLDAEDILTLVGCSRNPDRTGDDDRYLLRYETYDLAGNLLTEVSHPVPFDLRINELKEVPGSSSLMATGLAGRYFDTDAFLAVFSPEGQITNLSFLQPEWAEMNISPNPSPGPFQINLENEFTGELNIAIFNTQGQQVRQWSTAKATNEWQWNADLSELPSGSYFIRIASPEGQVMGQWNKL